jgi:hypothetical protein
MLNVDKTGTAGALLLLLRKVHATLMALLA